MLFVQGGADLACLSVVLVVYLQVARLSCPPGHWWVWGERHLLGSNGLFCFGWWVPWVSEAGERDGLTDTLVWCSSAINHPETLQGLLPPMESCCFSWELFWKTLTSINTYLLLGWDVIPFLCFVIVLFVLFFLLPGPVTFFFFLLFIYSSNLKELFLTLLFLNNLMDLDFLNVTSWNLCKCVLPSISLYLLHLIVKSDPIM